MVVDCSDVTFIDSSGVSMLIQVHHVCRQRGSTLSVLTQPVQVGSASNWSAVSAGASHTLGLRVDGTLWAWGANSNGELGDGTTTARLTPVQVGTLTSWTAISANGAHSAGLHGR